MRRVKHVFILVCCLLVACVAFAGCGEKASFAGTWSIESSTVENLDASSIDLMKARGYDATLTLGDDGSAILAVYGEKLEGTWEASSESADKATFVLPNGNTSILKLENGKLVVASEDGASSMTFARVPAAAETASGSAGSAQASSSASAEASSSAASTDAAAEASSSAASADAASSGEASASAVPSADAASSNAAGKSPQS